MAALYEKELADLKTKLKKAKAETQGPWIAAFDADGTLWDIDLGELFFEHQIQNCNLKLPTDPWKYYEDAKKVDPPTAYLWLAQINKGQPLKRVQTWAENTFVENSPFPIFKFQKDLIAFLHEERFLVYVVTASVKWAVEPGAQRLGIPASRVLGITTKVRDGVISDIQDGPITYRAGKAEALLKATNGVRPIFCAGNTLGDLHLLESATHVAAAIVSQKPDEHLFSTEQELQTQARLNDWICFDFSSEY